MTGQQPSGQDQASGQNSDEYYEMLRLEIKKNIGMPIIEVLDKLEDPSSNK